MTKLTALAVKNAKPGRNRYGAPDRAAYADGGGLYLIVQPSTGARSWALRYRFNGRTRNLRLGAAGDSGGALTLIGARARAAEARLMIERGADPADKRPPAGPDRVEALVEQFLDLHARRKTRTSSAKATESQFRRFVLPRWRGRSIRSIGPRDVIEVIERVAIERGAGRRQSHPRRAQQVR